MKNVTVEPVQSNNLSVIAYIHCASLPNDFLPSLGRDFLEQVYYPAAIQSKHAKTLVAQVAGNPVGFVTIAHDTERFSQDILNGRLLVLAKYALRATLRDPCHLRKSLEVFGSVMMTKPDLVKGEIVFIAVEQTHRGQGIGKQLVVAAIDYLRQKDVPFCRTKTLAENIGVIEMYEGLGWQVRDHFRLIGREYVTIVTNL